MIVFLNVITLIIIVMACILFFYTKNRLKKVQRRAEMNINKIKKQMNYENQHIYSTDTAQQDFTTSSTDDSKKLKEQLLPLHESILHHISDYEFVQEEDVSKLQKGINNFANRFTTSFHAEKGPMDTVQKNIEILNNNMNVLGHNVASTVLQQEHLSVTPHQNDLNSILQENVDIKETTIPNLNQQVLNQQDYLNSLLPQKISHSLNDYVQTYELNELRNQNHGNATYDALDKFMTANTLSTNYLQLNDPDYATLSSQITTSPLASKGDLNNLVLKSQSHLKYFDKSALAFGTQQSDLLTLTRAPLHKDKMKDMNKKMRSAKANLMSLPKNYIPTLAYKQISDIAANLTVKTMQQQHRFKYLINDLYVPNTDFDSLITQNMTKNTYNSLSEQIETLNGLVANSSNVYANPGYIEERYALQTTVQDLQKQFNSLPNKNIDEGVKTYLDNFFATPSDVANLQEQITAFGPFTEYELQNDFLTYEKQLISKGLKMV